MIQPDGKDRVHRSLTKKARHTIKLGMGSGDILQDGPLYRKSWHK